VQRDAHLQRIAGAAARRGSRGVVVVGPPGAGKTRLVTAALERADADGTPTAWVVATRASGGVPFGAVAHLLPIRSMPLADRVQLLQQTRARLASQHGGRRLVLGVDDVHLLDDASAALVQHLVATGTAFLLATLRGGEALPPALDSLVRDGTAERLDVAGLTREAVGELVGAVLGGQVDGAAVHELARLSEGNPLLLRELVTSAEQHGRLVESGGLWRLTGPLAHDRLRDLVATRLAALPPAAHEVVQTLAVAEPLEAGILEAMLDPAALAAADDAGLLEPLPDRRRQRLRLVHPLYGEVLRAALPPLRARRIHRRLADALQATGVRRRGDVLRLAIWRLEAGQTVGAEVFVLAARQANAVFDHPLAERLAGAALQAGAGFPAALLLAHALRWQGRGDEVLRVLAGWRAEATGDEQRAQAAITIAATLAFAQGRLADAERLLEEGARLVTAPAALEQLAGFRANLARYQWRLDDALAAAETVLANPAASPVALAQAVPVAAQVLALSGRSGRAIAVADRVLSDASRGGDLATAAQDLSLQAVCVAHAMAGRLAEARAIAEQRYRAALEQRAPALQAEWAVPLGHLALAAGEVASATRWLREALGLLRSVQVRAFGTMVTAWGGGCLAEAAALRGDVVLAEEALALADAALPAEVPVATRNLGRVWTAAARGDVPGAQRLALAAAAAADRAGGTSFAAYALHDAVRLGLAQAGLRGAVDRLGELAARDDGDLLPAFAASARARFDCDPDALLAAAEELARLGFLLLAAEAAAGAAALHREAGRTGSAMAVARRARALRDRCEGARTPALAVLEGPQPLTRRELEIASLAASGLSSRDIAVRLSVSVRTVDNHLYRAYTKLRIAGRDELPAVLGP
jgi:DNA-binding CsgD family transcriptional regulator/type II secretory pathway predicted ATPase ExeA